MKALKMLVLVLPIVGCGLIIQGSFSTAIYRSNTVFTQLIGVVLIVGAIVAIALLNKDYDYKKSLEQTGVKREQLAEDDDWNGPD